MNIKNMHAIIEQNYPPHANMNMTELDKTNKFSTTLRFYCKIFSLQNHYENKGAFICV